MMTDEQKAEIVRLRKSGLKYAEIANLANISYQTVRYVIITNCCELINKKRPYTELSAERLHAAAVDYYENDLTQKEVFKKHRIGCREMQQIRRLYADRYPKKRRGKKTDR